MATMKDFRGDQPTWCPGCGHFSVMAGVQKAAVDLGMEPHDIAIISGIGCSGKISEYTRAYGFHTLHGRSLPIAQGAAIGNKDVKVIAAGGDGDGYGIGVGHFVHAVRRNVNMTYIVMDNNIYGLTKGQTSPTSAQGFKTKSSPKGSVESPVHPLETALVNGVTFLAQGFSGDIKGLNEIMKAALQHKGFALVNVYSPCVTFNKVNTYDYYKENLVDVSSFENYDPTDRMQAIQKVRETNGLVTGILFKEDRPTFQELTPDFPEIAITKQDLSLDVSILEEIEKQFA
ncbi:MAG: 2-oxoacid:ferredoxin oxidoreductase subunit beta [Tepidibacillus sp.]